MRLLAALSLCNAFVSRAPEVVVSLKSVDGCQPEIEIWSLPGHGNFIDDQKLKRLLFRTKASNPISPRTPPQFTAGDNLPIRHPRPEDHDRAVNMDSRVVETARDGESTRPVTPSASSVDERWDSSPITVSPGKPFSFGSRNNSDYGELEQQDLESLPVFSPQARPYELEAAVPSRNIANSEFTAFQPGGPTQGSYDRSRNLGNKQAGSIRGLAIARPKPDKDVEAAPATAIHHSRASVAITKNRRRTDEGIGGDQFLGTGEPLRRSSVNIATPRTMDNLPSPSPTRLRSSQLGDTPGLLNLHDAQNEVLSLLDTLKTTQKDQRKSEVDAALRRCQEDLKARAKDKNTGTAESNILDREAAKIGRARDDAGRKDTEARSAASPGEAAAFEQSLRLALTRLIEDARAALEAVAQAKSQATSASRGIRGYIPYRVGEDFRLTALNFENRTLSDQVERLQAEKEQAQRENSDLQRRLDELLGELKEHRRDKPFETNLGPWGKEWNTDSRRSG